MKFNIKKFLVFLTFCAALFFFSNYMVKKDYERNKEYIGQIFEKDAGIQKRYGNIETFRLRKTGNYEGDSQENSYDYYNFYVQGSISSGVIELRIYKNSDEKNGRYVVKYIR